MTVSLPPELEALVAHKVEDGTYGSEAEVLSAALRLLEKQDELRERRIAELRAKAIAGLADLEAGRVSELSADDIKRIARERFLR